MRRARGSASVELVLIVPLMVVLMAGILYLHRAGMTGFRALHSAETATWKIAMSNRPGECIRGRTPHAFNGVSLGSAGNWAKAIAWATLGDWSFQIVNGGYRHYETRQAPPPPPPLPAAWARADTRGDYMPCAETVGKRDGDLPGAFNALWAWYLMP